jgi:ubiquinone/menaquinone biosynthesis C-methylase UbiE
MSTIEHHYGQRAEGSLIGAITAGLAAMGRSPESVTLDDLGPVDEFHIGGRQATDDLMKQLDLGPSLEVLDVGSGVGGAARFVASRYGCRVTGIDLTAEYVETARALSHWVGLGDRVRFHRGSALATPFGDAVFDRGYMLHVGMNIPDKPALFAEVARVIKPGGRFAVYDVMRTGPAELVFPVPWAATPDINALAPPDVYRTALRASGFELVAERNRRDFAIEFFRVLRERIAGAGGPPPLGLHLVMGRDAGTKVENMMANIAAGTIAPVEIIARRAV